MTATTNPPKRETKAERKAKLALLPQASRCVDCGRDRPCIPVVRIINNQATSVQVCSACVRHAEQANKPSRLTKAERIRNRRAAAVEQ